MSYYECEDCLEFGGGQYCDKHKCNINDIEDCQDYYPCCVNSNGDLILGKTKEDYLEELEYAEEEYGE